MRVRIVPSAVRETKWYEYLVRFIFGGAATAMAGVIAKEWGPVVGGLFLAFPAIFPASASLVEKHERIRKEKAGLSGRKRGRQAAAVDAAGAVLGSLGLVAFGGVIWWLAPRLGCWEVLLAATFAWCAVSTGAWLVRKKM